MRFRWNPQLACLLSSLTLVTPLKELSAELVAQDIAASAGITCPGALNCKTQGEMPAVDYDRDGDVDILLSPHGGSPWPLLRNDGTNRFKTVFSLVKTDRHGCVAADFGSQAGPPDGLPDIYCVTGACEGVCTKPYPNHLYLQTPTHGFVEVGAAWGVADVHGRGRVPLALDFDRDGDLDIAVVNESPSVIGSPNRLFRNVGGRFAEVAGGPFNQETASKCGKAADFNGDGWTDLAICTQKTSSVRLMTFKNNAGSFQDVTAQTAYKGLRTREFEFADVNGDGKLDLLILEETRFSVWLNDGQGRHPRMSYSRSVNLGRDLAVGDVNRDGKTDVYIVEGKNSAYADILLINQGSGISYRAMSMPRVSAGDGDTATAIPNWAGTGRTAFLVSNGKWSASGPFQLIVFSER